MYTLVYLDLQIIQRLLSLVEQCRNSVMLATLIHGLVEQPVEIIAAPLIRKLFKIVCNLLL